MTTREKWLLGILSGIFSVQASIFVWGFSACANKTQGGEVNTLCPDIGKRFDTTFGTMIATTLALLTGATVVGPAIAKQKAKQEVTTKTEPKIIPPYPERKPYTPPTPGRQ